MEVFDFAHVDVEDFRLQLARFIDKLLQQLDYRVDYVLVLTVD